MSSPKVSVVIACYNQAAYIREAVDSVLAQTFRNWEVILVDNGSQDDSHAILRSYAADPRVKLMLHSANRSITTRLNEAISETSGEYVSILYGDDFYLPGKLQRQVDVLEALPRSVGVTHGPGYRLIEETGERIFTPAVVTGADSLRDLLLGRRSGFINPIAPLFRRECWQRYPFDESVFVEGESVYFRYALTYQLHFDPEPLVVMRDHAANLGKATHSNTERAIGLLEKLGEREDFPASHVGALQFAIAEVLCTRGWEIVRTDGDAGAARNYLRRAVRVDHRHALSPRALAGLALTLLPTPMRGLLNRAASGR